MSTSDPGQRLSLNVRSADSATEIFIIDGKFNLRDRGIGQLTTLLEPGVYKVKVRAGFETTEQHVLLRDQDKTVNVPRFKVVSPVPLAHTSKTHAFHMGAAEEVSRNFDLTPGSGSSIFIFSRDWTSDEPPDEDPATTSNPGLGLTLRNPQGEITADLTKEGKRHTGWEPWVGCNVRVDPGFYTLSLELQDGKKLQQTIVASEGWQTQIFLLQRNYRKALDGRRADLQGGAIHMARSGVGFDPGNKLLRLSEFARLGLANQRRVLSDDVRMMLADKNENPMLGIFGGHLLLLDKSPDLNLLQTVIKNLRSLLPGGHPDVEALALQLNDAPAFMCEAPPMLGSSWSLIVKATTETPQLISKNSRAGQISTRVWNTCPWLIWFEEAQRDRAIGGGGEAARPLTNLQEIIQARLETSGPIDVGGTVSLEDSLRMRPPAQSRVESPFAAISKMRSERGKNKDLAGAAPPAAAPTNESAVATPTINVNDETINRLVRSLNIPKNNLEQLINQINTAGDEPKEPDADLKTNPAGEG